METVQHTGPAIENTMVETTTTPAQPPRDAGFPSAEFDDTVVFSRVPSGVCELRTQLWVPQRRQTVFEFFSDPVNLEAITPPSLSFRIVSPLPVQMCEGVHIDYKLRVHGVSFHWSSRITRWRPPCEFVDEQVRGPYHLWRHRHRFEEHSGGTLISDDVEYRPRGGWIMDMLFVRRDLEKVFRFRQQKIRELFVERMQPQKNRDHP